MKYNKHTDVRGSFQELFRQSRDGLLDVNQVSLLEINPKYTRGGHWHKKTKEFFLLLEGECEITLTTPDGQEKLVSMPADTDRVLVVPYVKHTLYSHDGCKMLILSNKEFNLDGDPDTYTETLKC